MADLLSYALCSVADVKESLDIDAGDTSQDNLIKRKINQATEMIEGWCGLAYSHHFKETTYTNEEYTGSGSNQVSLLMRPVTSITSFQRRTASSNIDDWDDVDSELFYSQDYSSGVINLGFTQGGTFSSYRVTYVAGYSTIPADLQEACVLLAGYLVENSSTGTAVKTKREGQRSIEYYDTSQSSDSLIETLGIDDMLSRYKNYVLA